MISIAILRVLFVLSLTIALLPFYFLGLLLVYFFGLRIVVLLIKKFWSRAVMKIIGVGHQLIGSGSKSHIFVSGSRC